jgi:hypothetical protein
VFLGLVVLPVARAGPTDVTISVTSVSVASNSAVIGWRASSPVRVYVEYGLSGEYGMWTKRVGPSSSGSIALPALEPDQRYWFRVVGLSAAGRAEASGSFGTDGLLPWAVATTTKNALFVDWQPLFPRMVLQTCDYYYGSALAAGINVFMGNACAPTEQLQLLDGRAYSILSVDYDGLNGRGLIGWFQQDEADGLGLTDLPRMPPSRESKRVTFLTLTDHFSSRSAPLPAGKAMYPRLISRAEMIGFDTYPLQTRCTKDFTLVYDLQRELVRLAAGKPTYQWIEAGPLGKCPGLAPSPATIRVETWLAIAGGARGIGYFPDFWPGAIGTTIAALNHEIAELAPALLAPEIPVTFAPNGTPVKAGARTLNGAVCIIAANPSFASARAVFTVPGLRTSSVSVFAEGRTRPVVNGRFSDNFRGLDVHVYVAAPPGT